MSTQHNTGTAQRTDGIKNYRTYQCWTVDTPVSDAIAAFRARYGCEPEYVYVGGSMLWVGPIPEENGGDNRE